MYKNLIFDLDNTLCPCSEYYLAAQAEVVNHVYDLTGVPRNILLNILKHIDGECTALPDGFNRTRFPRSFAAMAASAQIIAGMRTERRHERDAFKIGDKVFDQPYELYEGVFRMLQDMKSAGFNLVLYTLGDYGVQRHKVEKNKLNEVFDEANIHIVPKKEGNALKKIIANHEFVHSETVMIGDSLRGDIGSANDAGIASVWICLDDGGKWHYENVEATPTWTISHIRELPEIILSDIPWVYDVV